MRTFVIAKDRLHVNKIVCLPFSIKLIILKEKKLSIACVYDNITWKKIFLEINQKTKVAIVFF